MRFFQILLTLLYLKEALMENATKERISLQRTIPAKNAIVIKDKNNQKQGLNSPKIVGGYEVPPGLIKQYAFIDIDNTYFCGGFLVNRCWVITAGHCVYNFHVWLVTLGMHEFTENYKDKWQIFLSKKVILHENYDEMTIKNDIALISLRYRCANIPTDFVDVIKLPVQMPYPDFSGQLARVCGFGQISQVGPTPTVLNCVNITILPNADCESYYGSEYFTDAHICTSEIGYKGGCFGDSGGALEVQINGEWTAVGIVSYGDICGESPTVFTRLTSFLQWIHENVCMFFDHENCKFKMLN